MRSQEITQFTRQLATLLQSGVALMQALDIVIKGMPTGKTKTWCGQYAGELNLVPPYTSHWANTSHLEVSIAMS